MRRCISRTETRFASVGWAVIVGPIPSLFFSKSPKKSDFLSVSQCDKTPLKLYCEGSSPGLSL